VGSVCRLHKIIFCAGVTGLIGCMTTPRQSPTAPPGMVYIEGGIVTLGEYEKDTPHWGKREAFLNPYFIDINPGSVTATNYRGCMQKHGRLPEEAELNYAFELKKIEVGSSLEITNSDENLKTPMGDANTRVFGLRELVIVSPSKKDLKEQRRCLVPVTRSNDSSLYTLIEDVQPRSGRGNDWPLLPKVLKKGMTVKLFYKERDWVLIDLETDGTDSGGWATPSKVALKSK
jgi:hypothetical protein